MKKQALNITYGVAMLLALVISGCDGDDSPTPPDSNPDLPVEMNYAISTVSGAWPDLTTYIQGIEKMEFSTLGNESAVELTGRANTVSFGGHIYATPFGAPANLVKYTINDEGIPVEEERIVVPGANTFSTILFKSETEAYGTVAGGISKLIVFNPSTMRIVDEISLTKVIQRNPQATRTYYLNMEETGGKLFMGVHYENNFKPINDSAYVAVVDLESRAVDKVIADGRTGMVFGGQAPGAGIFKDANGDIYVQAKGTTNETVYVSDSESGKSGVSPSGILRIKNGTTNFDPDYFFNLEQETGNPCWGVVHFGEGLTFTKRVEDASDFYEYATGNPQFKYYRLNLAERKSEGALEGIPVSYTRSMLVKSLDEETLLFTTSTNDENAVYSYDITSGSISKKFVSTGGYITGIEKLK